VLRKRAQRTAGESPAGGPGQGAQREKVGGRSRLLHIKRRQHAQLAVVGGICTPPHVIQAPRASATTITPRHHSMHRNSGHKTTISRHGGARDREIGPIWGESTISSESRRRDCDFGHAIHRHNVVHCSSRRDEMDRTVLYRPFLGTRGARDDECHLMAADRRRRPSVPTTRCAVVRNTISLGQKAGGRVSASVDECDLMGGRGRGRRPFSPVRCDVTRHATAQKVIG
jgi:hypothetical protein